MVHAPWYYTKAQNLTGSENRVTNLKFLHSRSVHKVKLKGVGLRLRRIQAQNADVV